MSGKRKLGRATAHRLAMLRALVTFLLENGKIETTVTRAKEVRALAEKMITIAKIDSLHNKRMVYSFVTKKEVAKNLFEKPFCVWHFIQSKNSPIDFDKYKVYNQRNMWGLGKWKH